MNRKRMPSVLCSVILAVAVPVLAAEEHVEARSFDLKTVNALTLDMNHADISLVTGEYDSLSITLRQNLRSGDPALCLQHIEGKASGTDLKVLTKIDKKLTEKSRCNISRKIAIELPAETLQRFVFMHRHGSLKADSLAANDLSLKLAHTKLELKALKASDVVLELRHGKFSIDQLEAQHIEAEGAHADFLLNEFISDTAKVRWSHGDIKAKTSRVGNLKVHQSHGDILLGTHTGTALALHNSHGDIRVKQAQAEQVKLKNTHSGIKYSGSSDQLKFSNSHGDVKLKQQGTGFGLIEGKVKHGDVHLQLPESSVCQLTGSQIKNIRSDFFKSAKACAAEGGGGIVKLGSSHGHVNVTTL